MDLLRFLGSAFLLGRNRTKTAGRTLSREGRYLASPTGLTRTCSPVNGRACLTTLFLPEILIVVRQSSMLNKFPTQPRWIASPCATAGLRAIEGSTPAPCSWIGHTPAGLDRVQPAQAQCGTPESFNYRCTQPGRSAADLVGAATSRQAGPGEFVQGTVAGAEPAPPAVQVLRGQPSLLPVRAVGATAAAGLQIQMLSETAQGHGLGPLIRQVVRSVARLTLAAAFRAQQSAAGLAGQGVAVLGAARVSAAGRRRSGGRQREASRQARYAWLDWQRARSARRVAGYWPRACLDCGSHAAGSNAPHSAASRDTRKSTPGTGSGLFGSRKFIVHLCSAPESGMITSVGSEEQWRSSP